MKPQKMLPYRTVRVKLDSRNLVTFGVFLRCKCGKKHWITNKLAEPLNYWYCDSCDRPLVFIGGDGKMYLIHERVSERGVDDGV